MIKTRLQFLKLKSIKLFSTATCYDAMAFELILLQSSISCEHYLLFEGLVLRNIIKLVLHT